MFNKEKFTAKTQFLRPMNNLGLKTEVIDNGHVRTLLQNLYY
jgi:hypothetical protein